MFRVPLLAVCLSIPAFGQGDLCSVAGSKLVSTDAAPGDFFADALDLDGGFAVIGAEGQNDFGPYSGGAYVFERTGTTWTEVAKLNTTLPLDPGDQFGSAVAISGDRILVGADRDDDAGFDAGAVYVFERMGVAWIQTDKLVAPDPSPAALFGKSVALDGDTALVGAIRDDQNGQDAGAVYVLTESGGAWNQEAKLMASDGGTFAAFGDRVALEGDRAVVAAPEDDIDGSGQINDERGAVYVYERVLGAWNETVKLLGADSAQLDRFGGSIAVSGDRIAIGAPGQDTATISAGAVYVFELQTGAWVEVAELTAADAAASDLLGIALDLSDGTIVAGAVFDDDAGTSSGSVYVFENRGSGWAQAGKLVASDALAWDRFGCAVALDHRTVLVGAVAGDAPGAIDSGALYPFALGHDAVAVGTGLVGSGGFVPQLSSPTCAAEGYDLSLQVDGALGGSFGLLLIGGTAGAFPLYGGTLYVLPPWFVQQPHALGGAFGVPGAGTVGFTFPAQSTANAGLILNCQAGYLDAGAPTGVSLTQGLAVELP